MSKSLITTVYFNQFKSLSWVSWLDEQSNRIANELGMSVSHFDFRRLDKNVSKNGYKYKHRNLLYFENNGQLITDLTFYCLDKGEQYFGSRLSITVRVQNKDNRFSVLIFQIDESLLRKHTPDFFCYDLLCLARKESADIFGLVHVMENDKFPVLYFLDAPYSRELTKGERDEAKIWGTEGRAFGTIVRNIYWGNVITRAHWGNDPKKEKYLLTELQHECQGNVEWIDKDTVYFHAPFGILNYTEDQMEEYRQRLYKVMENCGIEVFATKL